MAKREKEALQNLATVPRVNILLGTSQDVKWLNLHLALAPGLGMHELLASFKQIPPPILQHIAAQVCLTLEQIHARDYVFRDLKASHVVIHADFSITLIDFGFAKKIGKTRTSSICGTLHAMPPEILKGLYGSLAGTPEHGLKADQYSFGVLLFEMICGKPPHGYFTDGKSPELKKAYMRQRLDQPSRKEDRDLLKEKGMPEASSLIWKLLKAEEERPDWDVIKESGFFSDTNWEDLERPDYLIPDWAVKAEKSSKVADFSQFIQVKGMFNESDLAKQEEPLTEEQQKLFEDF